MTKIQVCLYQDPNQQFCQLSDYQFDELVNSEHKAKEENVLKSGMTAKWNMAMMNNQMYDCTYTKDIL